MISGGKRRGFPAKFMQAASTSARAISVAPHRISCAIAMRMACDWFLLDSAALGSPGIAEVRWRKPVRPGDRLTMRRTVNSARPSQSKADRGYVAMLWELINQQGEVVMTLDATTILARREVRP